MLHGRCYESVEIDGRVRQVGRERVHVRVHRDPQVLMPEPRLHRLAGSPADAEEQQADSDETGRGESEHPEGERPERFRECPVGSDRRLGDGEEAQEGGSGSAEV